MLGLYTPHSWLPDVPFCWTLCPQLSFTWIKEKCHRTRPWAGSLEIMPNNNYRRLAATACPRPTPRICMLGARDHHTGRQTRAHSAMASFKHLPTHLPAMTS